MKRRLALVLGAGALLRLPFVPFDTGRTADVRVFERWAREAHRRGLYAVYDVPTVDYPPITLALFRTAAALERLAPARLGERVLVAGIKIWPVLADVTTAWLVAFAARRRGPSVAARAAALYIFNPAVWYVSAYWGQVDSIVALFMAASVVALTEGAFATGCLASAWAIGTKLQAVSLAPIAAAVTLRRAGWRGAARAASLTALGLAALLAPWILAGRLGDVVNVLTNIPSERPRVNVTGFNLWYLLHGTDILDSRYHPPGSPLSYQTIGIALYGALVGFVVVCTAKMRGGGRRGVALAAAACAVGLATLLTQVHERYLFPALAMVLLASVDEQGSGATSLRRLYVALSIGQLLNLLVVSSFTDALGLPLWIAAPSPRTSALKAVGVAVSVLNVGATLWLAARVARLSRVGGH